LTNALQKNALSMANSGKKLFLILISTPLSLLAAYRISLI
jgi:hypothetical protein